MSSFNEKILNAVSNIASTGGSTSTVNNPFKDKWVSILGDIFSAYEGYVPEGNVTFYPTGDIDSVDKMWWHQLLTRLGAKLCVNESCSDRKVCGDNEIDALRNSDKLHRVAGQTYINLDGSTEEATEDIQPDIILIMLGLNDFNNNITLGSFATIGFSTIMDDFYNDYNVMLNNLTDNYKGVQIYCFEVLFSCISYNSQGTYNIEFNEAINKEAALYGANVIHLSRLGVKTANYINQNTLQTMIANQCYNEMMASNCL